MAFTRKHLKSVDSLCVTGIKVNNGTKQTGDVSLTIPQGTVKSVNGVSPVNGNVNINATTLGCMGMPDYSKAVFLDHNSWSYNQYFKFANEYYFIWNFRSESDMNNFLSSGTVGGRVNPPRIWYYYRRAFRDPNTTTENTGFIVQKNIGIKNDGILSIIEVDVINSGSAPAVIRYNPPSNGFMSISTKRCAAICVDHLVIASNYASGDVRFSGFFFPVKANQEIAVLLRDYDDLGISNWTASAYVKNDPVIQAFFIPIL